MVTSDTLTDTVKAPGTFKNSIANQMFLAVFLIYLAISLAVTIAQVVEIYTRAESDLTRELQILGSSFKGSLAKALWEFDEESLKSSIQGLQEIPSVLGVVLLDINTGESHIAGGGFIEKQGENPSTTTQEDRAGFAKLIKQKFDVHFDIDGRQELVGRATVYSHSDVVLARIKNSVLVVILSEVIEIVALWIIFLWVSRKMLGQPLTTLTEAAERLSREDLKDFKVNIHARKQNELKLLEEAFNLSAEKLYEAKDELENRMRLALSAGRIATWVWHPDIDTLEFDDHLPSVFGQVPEGFGNSFTDLQRFIHDGDRAAFVKAMQDSVTDRKPLHAVFRVNGSDGAVVYVEVQAVINFMSENPDVPYLVGTAMDITERKHADEELHLAKIAAEDASNAKSEFLASMSHELRTPLNAILGFSEVLKEQYLGPLGAPKYSEYAKDIHSSGRYLLELVDELLDLSAIEAGHTELYKEIIRIDEIVEDCIRTVAAKINSKGMELSTSSAEDLLAVSADRRAIKQVVLNILSNAVKFTPAQGVISISTDRSKDHVNITVTDNGPGIAPTQLSAITAPFARGERTSHLAEKGWGLGLAISRSLVELHDGTLSIESEVNQGTSITISLPVGV